MTEQQNYREKGEMLLQQVYAALDLLSNEKLVDAGCRAYLHGQVYGLATALRIFFPGPGNLGEKAALALRPVLTEHKCQCDGEED